MLLDCACRNLDLKSHPSDCLERLTVDGARPTFPSKTKLNQTQATALNSRLLLMNRTEMAYDEFRFPYHPYSDGKRRQNLLNTNLLR